MLTDNDRATIAQIIKSSDQDRVIHAEAARVQAESKFRQYRALINAGFTTDQAFQLVLKST